MSYIKKRGEQAAQAALEEKKDFSKALVRLKNGTTFTVRFATAHDFVSYDAVSVFGKITTTPVLEGNAYEKAVKVLYKEAETQEEKKAEETRALASSLRPRERFLLAFYDLATGAESVVDLTKKQAQAIIQVLKKCENKLEKTAFELSKQGQGQSTTVTIMPVIDIDDLSKDERKHWKETEGKTIDDEIYDVLYMRNYEEQLEDLRKVGFDLAKIGAVKKETETETENPLEEYEF